MEKAGGGAKTEVCLHKIQNIVKFYNSVLNYSGT